jgi:protein-S-isoprenylcysteine O-methyltransferase Ste14
MTGHEGEASAIQGCRRNPALGVLALGYLLVAFEFFYMASPFALYFYSAYGPALRFLNDDPRLAWLAATFLPHVVVETRSALLDAREAIGASLAAAGFLAFLVGAGQVYWSKLARRGPVTSGLYRSFRHPQYAALASSGLGLLLLWPRFLALVAYVTMLFVYYGLARLEEVECAARFGPTYAAYARRTAGFVPGFALGAPARRPLSRAARVAAVAALYLASLGAAAGAAHLVRSWAIAQLYAVFRDDAAFVSVSRIEPALLERLVAVALEHPDVRRRLEAAGRPAAFLNYALPAEWAVPEIPMARRGRGHHNPQSYDRSAYRIVFTRADLTRPARGAGILLHTAARTPLFEVRLDARAGTVVGIDPAVAKVRYAGIPVPVF